MNYITEIETKIIAPSNRFPLLQQWKEQHKKIVFSNGCFDLLHRGHVDYLAKAAAMGDILIIGLNSDNSIQRLKGNARPIMDEYARAFVLASLFFVHAVVLFEQDTPLELIAWIQPDILVKGADYKEDSIVGASIVKENGGKVVCIDLVPGFSTTSIIHKIKGL
jgi:rfaE bifunctional protein nucleotidyltransferase chain/domain